MTVSYRTPSVISPCIIATYCWHGTTLLVTRRKPRASNCHRFAGNSPLPVPSIRKPSKPAIVWTTLNITFRRLPVSLDWTARTSVVSCVCTIPGLSNGGRRYASDWGWATTCHEAHACTVRNSTPRLWNFCVRTDISRHRRSPTPAVSPYAGLEQHLLFYHKDLVKRRIKIREKAVGQKRKGEITGRGTLHVPSPETKEK